MWSICVVTSCSQIRGSIAIAHADRDTICVDEMIELRVFACVLIMSACAGEPELASVEQWDRGGWCPDQTCGNSDEVAHNDIWEASLFGRPDMNGYSLRTSLKGRAQIYKDGVAYNLNVKNAKIVGTNSNGSISGEKLQGARLEVLRKGSPAFNITIMSVRKLSMPIGAPDEFESYTMVWHHPGTAPDLRFPFCNAIFGSSTETKNFQLYGLDSYETIVFEGDRFDPVPMVMNPPDDSWFNFGCAGHTLAKLYLNRYTAHTQPVDDIDQRQAMFKMMVGDYCGDGTTFTRAGEPIAWKGGHHPQYPSGAHLTTGEGPEYDYPLDARWNQNGAVCVRQPRMQISKHPDWATDFHMPSALERIRAQCPLLEDCDNRDPQDLDGALVVSANRIPPPN